MSFIGNYGLSDKTDGLYLGVVNLSIDVSNNAVLYSPNGYDIAGLNLGDGLNISGTDLKTVGNPHIQLTSNSLYANDNTVSIQSQIDIISQADVLYISAGSYGENLVINNKYNCALAGPVVGNVIVEVENLTLSGTSEMIRIGNLQIQGPLTTIGGVGRYIFSNIVFEGFAIQPNIINIGYGISKYVTFLNCEFDQYCTINVLATFGNVCYFINCNFAGATINLLNALPQQVIFNNCAGFVSYPSVAKCTFIGLNVLTTGVSNIATNLGNVECNRINKIKLISTSTNDTGGTDKVLMSDAVAGVKWVDIAALKVLLGLP